MDTLTSNLWNTPTESYSYLKIFGIIFPAMTGIMAGTNMSGNPNPNPNPDPNTSPNRPPNMAGVLRRAELSIPRGERLAICSALLTLTLILTRTRTRTLILTLGELLAIFSALATYAVVTVSLGACVSREAPTPESITLTPEFITLNPEFLTLIPGFGRHF